MRRWLPNSLAGRMIALLLLVLIAAQLITGLIFFSERGRALHSARQEERLARIVAVDRLLDATPAALHEQLLATVSGRDLRFALSTHSAIAAAHANTAPAGALQAALQRQLGRRAQAIHSAVEGHNRHAREHLSIQRADGRWLNVTLRARPHPFRAPGPALVSLGVTALALSAVVILMIRRITRPLSRLTAAADRVGRGETLRPLPEEGPEDVRRTTRAFNRMQARLDRFVQDRTRMLAAISHDLRTPLTSLRLRAEFIEDESTRQKVLETVDEMQRMTEATLTFARQDAAQEETRRVDLAALLDSLCADLSDLGADVTFAGAPKTPYACRPVALKRALRNLIENAVAYGQRARVALSRDTDRLHIVIDDDGPGIPAAASERLFEPFVRLEHSRNPATGGIGLGLSIARTIARNHGGDIQLCNRPEGGLRAILQLPR